MNRMVERGVALVLMTSISVGAAAGYNSAAAIKFQQPASNGNDIVMTINADPVTAQEYASYMLYNMRQYDDQFAFFFGGSIWDDPSAAAEIGASIPEVTKDHAVYTHVVLQKMEENHLKLPYQMQKEITASLNKDIENAGGEQAYLDWIANYGFDDTSYRNFLYASQCYTALKDYYFGENGIEAPGKEELLQQFRDNYIQAKHILVSTTDSVTGEQIRTDEEALEEAQAILERVNAGEDFDELLAQYNDDPGAATYPEGYIFTEGQMVQPFYDGAKALGENEISEPVKSDYGYHIIKRVPLDETKFDDYRDDIILSICGKSIDTLLQQWMDEADVQTTALYDEITYENVHDYSSVGKNDTGSNEEDEGSVQSE